MADTHKEDPVAAFEGLSLEEGVPTASAIQAGSSSDNQDTIVPIKSEDSKPEDGESEDGPECSEDEDGKTVIAENDSVPVQAGASSTEEGPGPATQGHVAIAQYIVNPVRVVTIYPDAVMVTFGNGRGPVCIMDYHMAHLDDIKLDFLKYNLVDRGFGDLVLATHRGHFELIAAVLKASESQRASHNELVARFCEAERSILAYRQIVGPNESKIQDVSDDVLKDLVGNIAQRVHGILDPLIVSIDDVVAILDFIRDSYQAICQLEINSDEYNTAVNSFDTGVATMMLYFKWAGNQYTHAAHDPNPNQTSEELKSLTWAELGKAISKARLSLPQGGNTIQDDAPSAAKHRSYDYFVRVTQYVSFLGFVEETIGFDTIAIWVSKAISLGTDAVYFLVTPVIHRLRVLLDHAGLTPKTGSPLEPHISANGFIQTSKGVRIQRALTASWKNVRR